MLTLSKYRVIAYAENEEKNLYVLDVERSGHIQAVSISRDEMRQDDLDTLLETGCPMAANIHDGRIMEFYVL